MGPIRLWVCVLPYIARWMLAGPGTPAPVVAKLNAEVQRVMRLPEIHTRTAGEGLRFMPTAPEQFAAFIRSEVGRWAPVVKMSGAGLSG